MTATSRASAPQACAMMTIAVAPPGLEPQMATVPGTTRQRANR